MYLLAALEIGSNLWAKGMPLLMYTRKTEWAKVPVTIVA